MLNVLLSGIPGGPSGVGRLIASLKKNNTENVLIIAPGEPVVLKSFNIFSISWWEHTFNQLVFWFFQILLLTKIPIFKKVVLIHPQRLGFTWVNKILANTRLSLGIYIVDTVFFCKRSYNYIPNENGPCLRCSEGDFSSIEKFNCRSMLRREENEFLNFMSALDNRVAFGNLTFFVQTEIYKNMIIKRFKIPVNVQNIGLWMEEFDFEVPSKTYVSGYDFVYHGSSHPAKGINWALQLATYLPERTFLFPFFRSETGLINVPKNCIFKPLSWEHGLKETILASKVCLLPTLWSAPIEGALTKTLILGAKCIVLGEVPFAHENILRVSFHPDNELQKITSFLAQPKSLEPFQIEKIDLISKLFKF